MMRQENLEFRASLYSETQLRTLAPGFSSQHLVDSSQSSITPGYLKPYLGLCGHCTPVVPRLKYGQNNPTHKSWKPDVAYTPLISGVRGRWIFEFRTARITQKNPIWEVGGGFNEVS